MKTQINNSIQDQDGNSSKPLLANRLHFRALFFPPSNSVSFDF